MYCNPVAFLLRWCSIAFFLFSSPALHLNPTSGWLKRQPSDIRVGVSHEFAATGPHIRTPVVLDINAPVVGDVSTMATRIPQVSARRSCVRTHVLNQNPFVRKRACHQALNSCLDGY